jgi:hypothetical protein
MEVKISVTEKWSNVPIEKAKVYSNDFPIGETDVNGLLIVNGPPNIYKICVEKIGYEKNCQTVNIISNTTLNIQLKPIVQAL